MDGFAEYDNFTINLHCRSQLKNVDCWPLIITRAGYFGHWSVPRTIRTHKWRRHFDDSVLGSSSSPVIYSSLMLRYLQSDPILSYPIIFHILSCTSPFVKPYKMSYPSVPASNYLSLCSVPPYLFISFLSFHFVFTPSVYGVVILRPCSRTVV